MRTHRAYWLDRVVERPRVRAEPHLLDVVAVDAHDEVVVNCAQHRCEHEGLEEVERPSESTQTCCALTSDMNLAKNGQNSARVKSCTRL